MASKVNVSPSLRVKEVLFKEILVDSGITVMATSACISGSSTLLISTISSPSLKAVINPFSSIEIAPSSYSKENSTSSLISP